MRFRRTKEGYKILIKDIDKCWIGGRYFKGAYFRKEYRKIKWKIFKKFLVVFFQDIFRFIFLIQD